MIRLILWVRPNSTTPGTGVNIKWKRPWGRVDAAAYFAIPWGIPPVRAPMMVRLGLVVSCALATFGAWSVMKPPSDPAVERLANGALVTATARREPSVEVTRSAPTTAVLPSPDIAIGDEAMMDATMTAVLDGLGFGDQATRNGALRDMTSGALEGIGGVTGQAASVDVPPLATLLIEGISGRLDDLEIAAQLNRAREAGEIYVPAALITTNGEVDATTLLATVVTHAKARVGQETVPVALEIATYSVQPGDSLGGIAREVLGDVSAYPDLMAANDDILMSPSDIRAGMLLVVPDI